MEETWEKINFTQPDVIPRIWKYFDFVPGLQPPFRFTAPAPSVTYSISKAYEGDLEDLRNAERDLNVKTLAAFRKCTETEQFLFAIDWFHQGFRFWPHRAFDASNLNAWRVPIFPNGDYYIFLTGAFSFGIFGHPWGEWICVFGQPLLDAFALDMPLLFTEIVRENR